MQFDYFTTPKGQNKKSRKLNLKGVEKRVTVIFVCLLTYLLTYVWFFNSVFINPDM